MACFEKTVMRLFIALAPLAGALRLDGQTKSSHGLATSDGVAPAAPEALQPAASRGCGSPATLTAGSWQVESVPMNAQGSLPPVKRRYAIYMPRGYDPNVPAPVLMVFHSWGRQDGQAEYEKYHLDTVADREGMVVVLPVGMSDCSDSRDCHGFLSWNGAGSAESSHSKMSCDLSVQRFNYCYDSCILLKGSCHPCDWTSCYDDAGFIQKLVAQLGQEQCIDRRRIFGYGCSNGGIFVHHLVRQLPGTFAGIVSSCGGKPHLGWEGGLPKGGPPVSMAILTGRNDAIIPLGGNASGHWWWDGYFYVSESHLAQIYRGYDNCTNTKRRRYGAGFNARDMVCWEEGFDCAGGSSVTTCTFAGGHHLNNGVGQDDLIDEFNFAMAFLTQHPLSLEYIVN